MFGIGLPELILIMAVALIVVGPEKLPDLAKSIAKGILELKKAAGTLKESLHEEDDTPMNDISLVNDSDPLSDKTSRSLPPNQNNGPATTIEPTSVDQAADASDSKGNSNKEEEKGTIS